MAMRPPVPSFCEIGSVLPAVVRAAGLGVRPMAAGREPSTHVLPKRPRRPLAKAAVNLRALIASSLARARVRTAGAAEFVLDESRDVAVLCGEAEVADAVLEILLHAAGPACGMDDGGSDMRRVRVSIRESGSWAEFRIRNASLVLAQPDETPECGHCGGEALANAHEIVVDRHEGQMYMESDETRGTTFFVRLPLNPAPGGR